ncbi:MAG: cytochrome c oxidase subunit II [Planctomycetaceae bacterium]
MALPSSSGTLAAVLLSGCHREHVQSVLHPASADSAEVAWLWWLLCGVCAAVFLVVVVLTGIAVARPRASDGPPALGHRFIVMSGIVVPSLVLFVLLVIALRSQASLRPPEEGPTIRVIGHQWWWEVEYPEEGIVTANELHIPVGVPVRIELRAGDVIHSFWVPNLNGKMDMLPERDNVTWLHADRPGVYRGQCAEYCGTQHALMALEVIALPQAEYDEWIAARQPPRPAPSPERVAVLRHGQQVFFEAGCSKCHAIRGTATTSEKGPDLTHIGSRRTIGAALLPNNRGNLAGWIANPQALKPGNLMPPTHLESADLHALVAYLESLK